MFSGVTLEILSFWKRFLEISYSEKEYGEGGKRISIFQDSIFRRGVGWGVNERHELGNRGRNRSRSWPAGGIGKDTQQGQNRRTSKTAHLFRRTARQWSQVPQEDTGPAAASRSQPVQERRPAHYREIAGQENRENPIPITGD